MYMYTPIVLYCVVLYDLIRIKARGTRGTSTSSPRAAGRCTRRIRPTQKQKQSPQIHQNDISTSIYIYMYIYIYIYMYTYIYV